ncbi:MAG: Gfo/Idh/MocA family oxidoreductase [Clostridiales bacterium]|nr:Gfo/Idh/MocA family oxidoreductase [Clostridiales bacterium]
MKEVKIGLVGANWMGIYHSIGMTNVRQAYHDVMPVFEYVADVNEAAAKSAVERFGYKKMTTDWHDLVNDPEVDMVIIATPNFTHAEIAIAAAKAGKHILCEKPMSNKLEDGEAMVRAVKDAGVKSLVDFIYTKCPANILAQEMMQSGKLGDFVTFRGEFDCSYCADPTTPATWRQVASIAGTGSLGDLTAHVVSLSDMIVGKKIVEVFASWDTVYKTRPDARDASKEVNIDTDDQIYIIVKYEDGRIGSMSSSRVSVARPDSLYYEIQGSRGSVKFELSHINDLQYYSNDCDPKERGYKTIKGNTRNGDYANFCGTDELGISYGDVMAIQAHDILTAITDGHDVKIDIAYGHYVDRILAAMEKSARENRWVKVDEI